MVTLQGKHIHLRALEPEDLDFIHAIENDESIWELSNTQTPYSKYLIKQYLEHAQKDIYEVKQLRLVITDKTNEALGMIDLFDFDFKNRRAGVGILVRDESKRNHGIGSEALELLTDYSFNRLNLHQLYCNISADNEASINLFTKQGFKRIGIKKDWNFNEGKFHDELIYQKIKN